MSTLWLIEAVAFACMLACACRSAVPALSSVLRDVKYRRARARLRLVVGSGHGVASQRRRLSNRFLRTRAPQRTVRAASRDATPVAQHRGNA